MSEAEGVTGSGNLHPGEKQPDAADAECGFWVVDSGKRGWGRWDGLRTTGSGFSKVSRNGPGTRGGEWGGSVGCRVGTCGKD